MKTFVVITEIRAKTQEQAEKVREEIAMGIEDARDSGELDFEFDFAVGDVQGVENVH